ncbi:hypothetical protein [Dongshaea marina]|uniref:hypothetical protein n=1 Tax=Dongshaea marina TaxID=2047966 RepID=UPI000D3E81BD|nr:hypothetical protein [Dongshaea marina]
MRPFITALLFTLFSCHAFATSHPRHDVLISFEGHIPNTGQELPTDVQSITVTQICDTGTNSGQITTNVAPGSTGLWFSAPPCPESIRGEEGSFSYNRVSLIFADGHHFDLPTHGRQKTSIMIDYSNGGYTLHRMNTEQASRYPIQIHCMYRQQHNFFPRSCNTGNSQGISQLYVKNTCEKHSVYHNPTSHIQTSTLTVPAHGSSQLSSSMARVCQEKTSKWFQHAYVHVVRNNGADQKTKIVGFEDDEFDLVWADELDAYRSIQHPGNTPEKW